MASVAKVRSRKDGAAIPLDDLDRKLLNLMQGRFPLAERPFAHVAQLAEVDEDEVLRRTERLVDGANHPPGHADLRHARARLQVDAGRREGRRREPLARRQDHQLAPGRLAQLPAQPRLQHLVHDRDRAGLEARPRRHARRARRADRRRVRAPAADAAAVQDPHGPGDGEGHRRARRRRRRRGPEGARRDRAVRPRLRGHPHAAGRHADRLRAVRAGRGRDRHHGAGAARAPRVDAGAQGAAPRRGDPLPPPRRLLGERHGRLEHPRGAGDGAGAGDGGLPRHLALLPAPDLRRLALLGLHDGPRPLEGGVRRDPRLDRRAHRHRGPRARSTPRPSSRRSASSTSPTSTRRWEAAVRRDGRSAAAYERARGAAAGRRELAGAGDALDRPRPDLRRARRRRGARRRRRQPLRRLGAARGGR